MRNGGSCHRGDNEGQVCISKTFTGIACGKAVTPEDHQHSGHEEPLQADDTIRFAASATGVIIPAWVSSPKVGRGGRASPCAGIEFWMSGDRERLTACRRLPTELDVAASLRDDLEAELAEDADDLEA